MTTTGGKPQMIHVILRGAKVVATAQQAENESPQVSLRAQTGQTHHHIPLPAELSGLRDPQKLHDALEKHLAKAEA